MAIPEKHMFQCPKCGHDKFHVHTTRVLDVDGQGNIAPPKSDMRYFFMDDEMVCKKCYHQAPAKEFEKK